MKSRSSFTLSGHFKLIMHSPRGSRVAAEFDNLILDAGLNRIGTLFAWSHCQVGTGSAAPTASDTALQSTLASTSTVQTEFANSGTYVAGPPAYVQNSRTYRFAAGVGTGNLSEIGVGWATTGSLFSRALILNAGGAPTPITKLADEVLDVVYTIRVYIPADVTGTITIGGSNYDYILRPSSVTTEWNPARLLQGGLDSTPTALIGYDGVLAAVNGGLPSGTQSGSGATTTLNAYSNNSLQRTFIHRFGLNDGNLGGGVKTLYLPSGSPNNFGARQIQFTPNLPKTASQVFDISTTIAWARRP